MTASAGIAGWVEMLMLRRTLNARIGTTGLPAVYVVKLWLAAASGAAIAWVIKAALGPTNPLIAGILILVPYGVVFFAAALALRIAEASRTLGRLTARLG